MTYYLPPCHFSGINDLEMIMSYGNTPIADKLLDESDLENDNYIAPLNLAFSRGSKLLQLVETVPADILYDDKYPYFSSVSSLLLEHFRKSARAIIQRKKLSGSSLVIEAASNDGYMLQNFISKQIPALGIEPARMQYKAAISKNIPTLNSFFTADLACELAKNHKADVFIGNNILAHAEDLNDFVRGISILIKPDGLAVIEVPYVVDMVRNCEFDTVYHQHIYYFSLMSLVGVFKKYDLHINEVEHTDIHGGSLRIFIEHTEKKQRSVMEMLECEDKIGVGNPEYYKLLSSNAEFLKEKLTELIQSLKNDGGRIAAYGAAAKATTFMSYMGIDKSIIDYIVDRNPYKHNKYMPGCHLKIFPESRLVEDMPEYTLLFAWNFSDEIIEHMKEYRELGGKFIRPIPDLEII